MGRKGKKKRIEKNGLNSVDDAPATAVSSSPSASSPVETLSSSSNQSPEPAGLKPQILPTLIVLSLLSFILFSTVIIAFARYGEDFIRRRDYSVGEVLMREGKRLEESSVPDKAQTTYERALLARFNDPKNRTFTLERLGRIYWGKEHYNAAVEKLLLASTGQNASIALYEGLVDSLIRLGRLDEAQQHIEAWTKRMNDSQENTSEQQKLVLRYTAFLSEKRGDMDTAIAEYEKCFKEYSDAESAARLAELLAERGDATSALRYLDHYFLLGAPRKDNKTLRKLYSSLALANPNALVHPKNK